MYVLQAYFFTAMRAIPNHNMIFIILTVFMLISNDNTKKNGIVDVAYLRMRFYVHAFVLCCIRSFAIVIHLLVISLHACACFIFFCVCALVVNMVRVSKFKSKTRKVVGQQTAAAASASDIGKAIQARAAVLATTVSQAEDAAMALYEMETSLANTSSFDLERFIATAKAVDAAQAASAAAAKVLANATSRFGGISVE